MSFGAVAGAVLVILAFALLVASQFQQMRIRDELIAKRPELMNFAFGPWWTYGKQRQLEEMYRAEFPESRRTRRLWTLQVVGVVLGFAGFWLLVIRF